MQENKPKTTFHLSHPYLSTFSALHIHHVVSSSSHMHAATPMHVINGYIEATLPPTYTNGRSTSSMRIQKQRADMCGKSYPQSCPLHSQKHFWRNNGLQCVYPRHKPNDRLPKVLIPPIHEGILGVCPPQPLVTLFLPLQAPTIIFFLVFATVSKI